MNDIRLIRLLNGQDVIGKVVHEGEDFIRLKNPLIVALIPQRMATNNNQQPTVGFAPFAPFAANDEFELDKSGILCIMDPVEEFISQYNTMFTGLVTPTNKLILP
jgi:hypothetical protein